MIKKVFGRKLGRGRPAREALFASLSRAIILNGKIVTTKAKAKAVQRDFEKIVTLAKKADLSARRRVLSMLDNDNATTDKIFAQIAVSFKDRFSGFTRIINLTPRKGDNTPMVRMEWTEVLGEVKKEEKVKPAKVKKEEKKVVKKTKTAKK
jgi:large subunit ribosomal protein L17